MNLNFKENEFKLHFLQFKSMMTQNSQVCSLSLESQQQHVQRLNYKSSTKSELQSSSLWLAMFPPELEDSLFDINGLVEAETLAAVLAGIKCETQWRLLLDHH